MLAPRVVWNGVWCGVVWCGVVKCVLWRGVVWWVRGVRLRALLRVLVLGVPYVRTRFHASACVISAVQFSGSPSRANPCSPCPRWGGP